MPLYWILVEGENLLMEFEGEEPKKLGFYTPRLIDAADEATASSMAINSVHEKLEVFALNEPDDPVEVVVDDIHEVDKFEEFEFDPDDPPFIFHGDTFDEDEGFNNRRLILPAVLVVGYITGLITGWIALVTLVYLYLALFISFMAWTIWDDFKDSEPVLETTVDILALVILGGGVVLYLFGNTTPGLRFSWLIATPIVTIAQTFYLPGALWSEVVQDPDKSPKEYPVYFIGTILIGALLFVPGVWMCVLYSLGGQ